MKLTQIFSAPINEITPEMLSELVVHACDHRIPGALSAKELLRFRDSAKTAIAEYFVNQDHGYAHSLTVYDRALEIARQSPNMVRLAKMAEESGISDALIGQMFVWAAVFHDLMRFFGCGTDDHEGPAAELARSAFFGVNSHVATALLEMIIHHDYLCPTVDGELMPKILLNSPLAEIVRLADKTSNPPAAEVDRWLSYAQGLGLVFFNPDLSDANRFDLQHNSEQRDQTTFLLAFFALQPSDFYAREAAEIYRQWAAGKMEALCRLMATCREQGVSEQAVLRTVIRFHEHHHLSLPEGIEGMRIFQELRKGKI